MYFPLETPISMKGNFFYFGKSKVFRTYFELKFTSRWPIESYIPNLLALNLNEKNRWGALGSPPVF